MFKIVRKKDRGQEPRKHEASQEPERKEPESDITALFDELLKKEQENGP